MNMIHQVQWAVRLAVAAGAGQQAHSETRTFWLEFGANPEHFYNKRKTGLDTVLCCGLTGRERDISVEEVESHSGENWLLVPPVTLDKKNGVYGIAKPSESPEPVHPTVVLIHPGQTIIVRVADSDGEFAIRYGKDTLTVGADMPDATGREGIIYEERFGPTELEKLEVDVTPSSF